MKKDQEFWNIKGRTGFNIKGGSWYGSPMGIDELSKDFDW
jgi:hypothetical protein